jgi:SAM-dependent methyltransferase
VSITRHLAELMLIEHRNRRIGGEVLLLGRQVVWMTIAEAEALVDRAGIAQPAGAFRELSRIPNSGSDDLISDVSFFSLFTDAVVKACDVSDHEAADFIFNLAEGIPDALLGRFDFIYNGSVLDNVFDPVACIRNVSRMLKPEGLVFGYEGIAHAGAAYLKFSPEWFFDYYALNGFADCQTYVATCDDVHLDSFDMYEWSAFTKFGLAQPLKITNDALVACFAQNAPSATWDKSPIQGVYRSEDHAAYRAAFGRYAASPRRKYLADGFPTLQPSMTRAPGLMGLLGRKIPAELPPIADGHRYLGKLGAPRIR